MSEFIEYPKMLYRDGEQLVVDDATGEDAARVDGFHGFGEPVADPAPTDAPDKPNRVKAAD